MTIWGEQDIIVRYAPDEAMATLPDLLRDEADRARFVTLVRRLVDDPRVRRADATAGQIAMVDDIRRTLTAALPAPAASPRKRGNAVARKRATANPAPTTAARPRRKPTSRK